MASILDRITGLIRVNISDGNKSRYSDAELLTFFRQAIRRAQFVGFENRFDFMREKFDFTLGQGATQYQLPANFIVQAGVWRTDTRKKIEIISDLDEFETGTGYQPAEKYMINGNYIEFIGAATADIPIRIRYYADAMVDTLTLQSQMPWGGRLDYPICEYVMIRALHVDKYTLSTDFKLLADLEQKIVFMYMNREAVMGEMQGAFS